MSEETDIPKPEKSSEELGREDKIAAARAKAAERRAARLAAGATPEDNETDSEAAARANAVKQRAAMSAIQSKQQAADIKSFRDDPSFKIDPSIGPKVYPPDFSDPDDPASTPYAGAIAPAAAGERSRAEQAKGIKDFIEKYSKLAVDSFSGSKSGEVGVFGPKAGSALAAIIHRFGKQGELKGVSQMMSKEKALKLVDKIPSAPQDEAMQMQRELARYIWTIHQNARSAFKKAVMKQLGLTNDKIITIQKRDADGEVYYDQVKPSETEKFKSMLAAVSKQFDDDSKRVKGDLNLLASASGSLSGGAGRGGKADARVLDKKPRFGRPPAVIAKQPTTRLSKDLKALAAQGDEPSTKGVPAGPAVNPFTGKPTALHEPAEPAPTEPQQRTMVSPKRVTAPGTGSPIVSKFPTPKLAPPPPAPKLAPPPPAPKSGRKWPIIRRKPPSESIDRYMDQIIEIAVADRVPTWWDDL